MSTFPAGHTSPHCCQASFEGTRGRVMLRIYIGQTEDFILILILTLASYVTAVRQAI